MTDQLSEGFDSDDWDVVREMRGRLSVTELWNRSVRFGKAARLMTEARECLDDGDADLAEFDALLDDVKAAVSYYTVAKTDEEPAAWICRGCGTMDIEKRYDNGDACDACVMNSFAEAG